MKLYDFKASLQVGQEMENFIDTVLSPYVKQILPAKSMTLQRLGIDRFILTQSGYWYTVEYKADIAAGRTGNFFLETAIEFENGKTERGWLPKLEALFCVICVPTIGRLYFLNSLILKRCVENWLCEKRFEPVRILNKGYVGVGIPVAIETCNVAAGFYFDGEHQFLKFSPTAAPKISQPYFTEVTDAKI
jgi:hypothetical protein